MKEAPDAIRSCFQRKIDIRIGYFIARGPVADHEKDGIFAGQIQEMMPVAGARRKADARAGSTVSRPASVTSTNSPSST